MTPQTEVRESPPNVQTSEGEVVYLLCMEKEVAWDENTHDPWAVIMNVACWSEPRKFGRLWTGGQGEWCVSGSMLHCADQSCPTLCYPMDYSPLGSSVHGISQARILEWVAISYPRGSSRPRDWTHISCISCIGRWILYHWATWEAQGELSQALETSQPWSTTL